MSLDRAIDVLEMVAALLEIAPVLGTPLKSAVEAATKSLQYAHKVKANKKRTRELARVAAKWMDLLLRKLSESKEKDVDVVSLSEEVEEILRVLKAIEESTARRVAQGRFLDWWNKNKDAAELERLHDALDVANQQFMTASNLLILSAVQSASDRNTLDLLQPIATARHNARDTPDGCCSGTRSSVLDMMLDWAHKSTIHCSIFWLGGLAGTGKSTIAKTFCEQLVESGDMPVISFFVSKTAVDRKDPLRILHNFIFDLANVFPVYRERLIMAIRGSRDVFQQPVGAQIYRLLIEPLEVAKLKGALSPVMLVIDALDECMKISGVEGGSFIPDMAKALHPFPIKMMITSRIENTLSVMFNSIENKTTFRLHDVPKAEVMADVRRIFVEGFANIAAQHHIETQPWPTADELDVLSHMTGNLFIFATTVLKYVGETRKTLSAPHRLRHVLNRRSSPGSLSPFSQLDLLYMEILAVSAQNNQGKVDDEICERLRKVVPTICLLHEPLDVVALAALLKHSDFVIDMDVQKLASVLLIDAESEGTLQTPHRVRIFHPSFKEFLLERSANTPFEINIAHHHLYLATRCLDILNTFFSRGVSGADLSQGKHLDVPRAVQYASRFWLYHLSNASAPDAELFEALSAFTKNSVSQRQWVELLSGLWRVYHIIDLRFQITSWCQEAIYRMQTFLGSSANNTQQTYVEIMNLSLNEIYQFLLAEYYMVSRSSPSPTRSRFHFPPLRHLISPTLHNLLNRALASTTTLNTLTTV